MNPASQNGAVEKVIEVENLVASYRERTILKGLTFDVRHGEIMVIMGGSGSGKTTLLRNLLGLMEPDEGSIRVFGREIVGASPSEMRELRKRMGVSFQGGALFGSMTLAENVQLPLREHTKLDEETIRIMTRLKLEFVDLSGYEDLMPSELSGGMVKRGALARAIVMDPKLLFFDEPSSGLDPVVSAELDQLILDLRQAMDMSIVVVTHDMASALKIADRITVIDRGNLVISGTVDEVQNCPDERVQNLLHRRPRKASVDAEEYLRRLTQA
ncbi:MAG: ATP-binding cassette domain-containing protein [Gammaproteobacteria bacterium]|nr:ATP-binding cassette domain-containing protein [Gammaproteobacteria bacterium]